MFKISNTQNQMTKNATKYWFESLHIRICQLSLYAFQEELTTNVL